MADNNMFELKIIEPDGLFFEGEASFIEFTSVEGKMGVYANHIPLTTILEPCVVKIYNGDEKKNILDEYTFDNFIEGASNKFAKAACYAVAKEPNTYNPLFIYGNSGLGKTHLLYAIMNYMRKNSLGRRLI